MDQIPINPQDTAALVQLFPALEAFKGYFSEKQKLLADLEDKLHYKFRNPSLLIEALSHRSAVSEFEAHCKKAHIKVPAGVLRWNERLEFLGDSVLGLTVTTMLWKLSDQVDEGQMSRMKAASVSEAALAKVAKTLNLGTHIFLGRGERQAQGAERDSLLADCLEAVFGAVYLDAGIETAMKIVSLHLQDIVTLGESSHIDYKTAYQELVQQRLQMTPTYLILSEVGPDHRKNFEVGVYLNNKLVAKGLGLSKKSASMDAARQALILEQN